jgi:hypothetical protein
VSEWNYTKCSQGFTTQDEAREFMVKKSFAGHILLRGDGSYTAVCPTYPDGYYPDARTVETMGSEEFNGQEMIENESPSTTSNPDIAVDSGLACCSEPQLITLETPHKN